MLRSWTNAGYLGHQNLKNTFDNIKRSFENVALSAPVLTVYPDTMTAAVGLGGMLRVGGTFMFRIEDVTYIKGTGITQAINSGDATIGLLQRTATDQTAASDNDITATYFKAGVLLIDADGNFSVLYGSETGRQDGIPEGARLRALSNLLNTLSNTALTSKAIVCFFVIGDGTNAFTSTSSLTISTNLDLYQVGGMAIATGQSTDGGQMLGAL